MSAPSHHREVERKFRVSSAFTLPDLQGVDGVSSVEAEAPLDLVAAYHDTEDLTLIRWRTTLRRREGGPDEGWHLKLPVAGTDGSTRDELHLPLTAGPEGAVPAQLADIVSPLVRGAHLTTVARVRTARTPFSLCDASGDRILELVDDHVQVTAADGTVVGAFREIEVEVVAPDSADVEGMLEAVSAALLAAGAEPSSVTKAASALGARAADEPDVPMIAPPAKGALAVDVLQAALADHVRRLLLADVGVRRDLPDAVHQMRVAARRLRSILRTYRECLATDWAEGLSEELKWLASELGAIRDTEVMRDRLDAHAARLGEPDAEAARRVVDVRLTSRLQAARSGALAALRSDRHAWLLEDLIRAVHEPSVNDEAYRPAARVLPPHARHAWRRFAKAVRVLDFDSPSSDWHAARIAAKRARYAVEALVPVSGPRVGAFATALAEATEMLGEHQDAHIAQHTVRTLADSSQIAGPEAFALGRLHDLESEFELIARLTFLERWPVIARTARKSGMV